MSTCFYYSVKWTGRFIFWQSSRAVVLHRRRLPRQGPFILAANHVAHFDPAVLIAHAPRMLEFVTMGELLAGRMGWFFRGMNTIPVDRGRVDARAVREAVERLKRGRAIGIFPEGRIRKEADSVVLGGAFGDGAVRMAKMASVPIIPAVVWGTGPYVKWWKWLPLKSVRYGVIYGHAFDVADETDAAHQLAEAWKSLYAELAAAMD